VSTDTSSIASHDDTPLLFISHRHADREIADVVRKFINYQSRGDVKVYQRRRPMPRLRRSAATSAASS